MSETIIVALIGFVAAVLAGNGLWDFIKSRTSKPSALEAMVLALGRERLLRLSRRYIEQGYVPEEDFDTLVKLGEAYIAMGGNSTVRHYYQQAIELPRK